MNATRTVSPPWIRAIAGITAAVYLATGLWAVVAPKSWFDNYPGFGEPLVAAEPPFNAHLAGDAGAGFLAVGVALLVAAIFGERLAMLVAALALFAHAAPHLVFHVMNPAGYVNASTTWTSLIGLVVAALIPIVLFASVKTTKEID